MKNIMVLGADGRQASIIWKLLESKNIDKIYYVPGRYFNDPRVEQVNIPLDDWGMLYEWYTNNDVEYVVTDSSETNESGIVDYFQSKDAKIIGPNRNCARLESSKSFAKHFMNRHNIPTAEFHDFTNFDKAKEFIQKLDKDRPIVVKADGLVRGRGVVICKNKDEAMDEISAMMQNDKFGEASRHIVIEDYLEGPEVSLHVIMDGEDYKVLPLSQDHKPLLENNEGPNTGGMGSYAPVDWVSKTYMDRIITEIIKPTISGLKKEGLMYKGVLFPGLILTRNGPKVLEYNARFGAPETQSYMMILDSDLDEIFQSIVDGKLAQQSLDWKKGYGATVEIVPSDYPQILTMTPEEIYIDDTETSCSYFLSGSDVIKNKIYALGGKTMSVSSYGETLQQALENTYKGVDHVRFGGMHYRKDIGKLKNGQY